MRPYVAGVDTSTQSCKVIIWDPASGQIVREGKASHPDGTEVHPDHWWAAFEQALDAAGGLDDVHALSVGGQQHGMVCLDADGQVIRPALLWNDTRSAQAAVDLIEECGTAVQEGADALPSDGESQHPEELVTAHDAGKRWPTSYGASNSARCRQTLVGGGHRLRARRLLHRHQTTLASR